MTESSPATSPIQKGNPMKKSSALVALASILALGLVASCADAAGFGAARARVFAPGACSASFAASYSPLAAPTLADPGCAYGGCQAQAFAAPPVYAPRAFAAPGYAPQAAFASAPVYAPVIRQRVIVRQRVFVPQRRFFSLRLGF